MDFLQKIQNKPRHIRVQILWISVAISMAAIFYLWTISLKRSFPKAVEIKESDGVQKEASESLKDIKKETISLKESLKASFGAFFEKNESAESTEIEERQNNSFIEQPSAESQNEVQEIKPAKLPIK